MKCVFLTMEDAPLVEELWDSCFEKRNEAFFQFYFHTYCFKHNRVFGGFNETGELISMLHLNPYTLRINGKETQAAYIVGVATAEKFRGHHYMGTVLKSCLEILQSEGMPFVFLMPVAEAIYSPYGFVGVDYHTFPSWEEVEREFSLRACPLEKELLADFYRLFMKGKNGVLRSAADWDKLIALGRLEGCRAYIAGKEGEDMGYIITDVAGKIIESIIPGVIPQGQKAFIMAKCLQGQDCNAYFGNNLYINEYF